MGRRRRLPAGRMMVFLSAGLAATAFGVWLYGGSYLRQREFALARAAEVAARGPPCPAIARDAFEALRPRKFRATLYEGVTFGRQFGHMDCRTLRYGGGWSLESYPACQFTGPGLLQVTTKKGQWFFAPGPGQPATVAVPHGQAQCVMASNFTIPKLIER